MVLAASLYCHERRFSENNRSSTWVYGPGARRREPFPHLRARGCEKSAKARCDLAIAEMSYCSTPRAKFMLNSLTQVWNTCIANSLTQVWKRTPPKNTQKKGANRFTQGGAFFRQHSGVEC